ncbi:MAG: putative addiction module antidote protein [Parachlamydia sp.]|nr:putative addiction module antidote protein [Parachlamydia sp.]
MRRTKNYKEHLLKSLQDLKEAAAYLNACIDDEDPHVFLLALKDVAEARGGMSKLSRESSLNRQSLYRALSKNGNPKLSNIRSILVSLGMNLHITQTARVERLEHSRLAEESAKLDIHEEQEMAEEGLGKI